MADVETGLADHCINLYRDNGAGEAAMNCHCSWLQFQVFSYHTEYEFLRAAVQMRNFPLS